MKSHPQAGGWHLRGKRSRVLPCKCCVVRDLRAAYWRRQAAKEMRQ